MRSALVASAGLAALAAACSPGGSDCGPTSGTVARVIDGDTIELESGEAIRYLMVDTPENTSSVECYGPEAAAFNADLVEGKDVEIEYDEECTDRYDRLLAWVSVDGREVNSLLVERGFGCVLFIPPSGADREEEFDALEATARSESRGLWGACPENPCN